MQVTPELIQKYHLGQCTPEEEAAVLRWLGGEGVDEVPQSLPESEREVVQSRIWSGIGLNQEEACTGTGRNLQINWKWARLAASVLIFSTLSWLIFKQFGSKREMAQSGETRFLEIRTARGERKKLYLPDSSLVYLNADSHLRFPVHFTDTSRRVILTGEAFFEISKDPSRPFTIETSHTETRVLGTVFNLKAYPNEETSVAVVEGKVRFGAKDKHIILTANQLASFEAGSRTLAHRNVYAAAYAGWKQNRLVFRDSPLSEIAVILERWYGVRIEVRKRALSKVIFTGTYENPSLQTVLNDMSSAMKFTYTQEGNQLFIQ